MKKVTIDKVEQVLEKLGSGELEEITLSDEILTRAAKAAAAHVGTCKITADAI